MYGGGSDCHVMDDPPAPPNGSKVVTLLFRLSTLALALTSAVVMATASECTIYDDDGAATTATVVTFNKYQPFVYLVGSNIAATILEVAAIYLQVVAGNNNNQAAAADDIEEDAPPPPPSMINPQVVLVAIDVAVQVLLYSAAGAVFAAVLAYGPQISACAGAGAAGGHFCEQVHRSKIISLAASLAAGLAVIAKDVPLPFSVWPHM